MSSAVAARIARLLSGARHLLLTSHCDPDGDSIGSQLAFYEYWTKQRGRTADVITDGALPTRYRFLDPGHVIRSPYHRRRNRWDAAVIFECSSLDRVGAVAPLLPAGLPIVNIDHHQGNSRFGTINVVDAHHAACTELVYALLRHWRAPITPRIAQLLAAGILTDTGRFHHPSTNVAALRTTTALVRSGADLTELANCIYFSMPEAHFRLLHHILGRAELHLDGRVCLLMLREADRERFGVPMREMEGLVDQSLSLAGVKAGALLKEIGPQRTKISLRSAGAVDVSALAQRFGGGGHRNASGCFMDLPLRAAANALLATLEPLVGGGKRHRARPNGR